MTRHIFQEACRDDIADLARLHVASWQATYRGLLPDAFLARHADHNVWETIWTQVFENRTPQTAIWVAAENERLLGYFNGGPTFSQELRSIADAEVHGLYLLPESQGMGIGTALFRLGMEKLTQAGFSSIGLWVFAENTAVEFYRTCGGQEVLPECRSMEIDGLSMAVKWFRWSSPLQLQKSRR